MFVLRGAWQRFFTADGFFLGAGLAFFTLITIIPLVLLGIATLGFVLTSEEAANEVISQLTRNFPVYRREVRSALMRIVETRAATGVLGTVILVVFASPLFSASRLVLHRLLGIKAPASYVRNFLTDSGMVLLLGLLLFGATLATWFYQTLEFFVLEPSNLSTRWINAANLAFSVALSTVMLYLGYRFVPRRRPRSGSALTGAIVASLLWEVAKQLFAFYIRKVGVYDQIYGPLGVLVAFVMFVYYTAVVFVFGGAYVAALESRRRG
jgi:membrane protein